MPSNPTRLTPEREADVLRDALREYVNWSRSLAAALSRGDADIKKRFGWRALEQLDARHQDALDAARATEAPTTPEVP